MRWRIVLIYFLLVFIAMAIVSVYLMSSMEKLQLSSLKQNIESTVSESNLLSILSKYAPLSEPSDEVQSVLVESWGGMTSQEISVVGRNMLIVASTNPSLSGRSAAAVFDADLLSHTLVSGEPLSST